MPLRDAGRPEMLQIAAPKTYIGLCFVHTKQVLRRHKWVTLGRYCISALIFMGVLLHIHTSGLQKNHQVRIQQRDKVVRQINDEPSIEPELAVHKQRDFVHQFAALANEQQDSMHISPSLIIGQAALESNWGKSPLYQDANNAFGVKGYYHGHSITYSTDEFEDGHNVTIKAKFRRYPSVAKAVKDHDKLIRKILWEEGAKPNDYVSQAKALQDGGYATDPQYARKLMKYIEQNDLDRFD